MQQLNINRIVILNASKKAFLNDVNKVNKKLETLRKTPRRMFDLYADEMQYLENKKLEYEFFINEIDTWLNEGQKNSKRISKNKQAI
jgi:chromosomal replication initiation ATPase DnaA